MTPSDQIWGSLHGVIRLQEALTGLGRRLPRGAGWKWLLNTTGAWACEKGWIPAAPSPLLPSWARQGEGVCWGGGRALVPQPSSYSVPVPHSATRPYLRCVLLGSQALYGRFRVGHYISPLTSVGNLQSWFQHPRFMKGQMDLEVMKTASYLVVMYSKFGIPI